MPFLRKHLCTKYNIFNLSTRYYILSQWFPPKLTLYDTTEMKPVSHLDLKQDEKPYDVCLIPGDKVAVTCRYSNTIVIVSVKNNHLQREHDIHIDCWPLCITSHKEDLFVVTVNVITYQMSISRVALTGDRHVVCDLPEGWKLYCFGPYSMTTSKESKPKIYVAYNNRRDVLEVSLDGSTLRYISMSHKEADSGIMNSVSVGENILCLFTAGKRLKLADINSKNTSVVMKQIKGHWGYMYMNQASVCPVTKTLLIWDDAKLKIKMFKWK